VSLNTNANKYDIIKASTARALSDKSEDTMCAINDINKHITIMSKLGFTNTSFYVFYRDCGHIIDLLISKGYNVFSNVNPHKGVILLEVEWH